MKLTKSNINRFDVVSGERNDETVAVLELCGDFDGVLLKDNAGWSLTVDNSYEEVLAVVRGEDSETELRNQSVVVEGIAVQKGDEGFRILEGQEAVEAYYLV